MNTKTIGIGIAALIMITSMSVSPSIVNAQFAVGGSGVSFTSEDLAQGLGPKAPTTQKIDITSESMLPYYVVGEHATLDYSVPFESIQEGDVIAFIPDPEEIKQHLPSFHSDLIMHRVVDVDTYEDNTRTLTTQGDYNDIVIEGVEEDITVEQYVGKIVED